MEKVGDDWFLFTVEIKLFYHWNLLPNWLCIIPNFCSQPTHRFHYELNGPWFWYSLNMPYIQIWPQTLPSGVNYHNKCNWNGKFITFIFERISRSLLYVLPTFSSQVLSSFVHVMKVDVAFIAFVYANIHWRSVREQKTHRRRRGKNNERNISQKVIKILTIRHR